MTIGDRKMKKRIIFATIPMLPQENLKKINYRKENTGEFFYEPSRFPSIPMIEDALIGSNDIKIIAVKTDDDNGRADIAYKFFLEELEELSERTGRELKVEKVIHIPHDETTEKQLSLLKEICKCYEKNADIYMDITFGTKVTPIGMFSSLVFAEKVKGCSIKNITYGKFAHNDSNVGNLYNVKFLYDISSIINAADYMPQEKIESLVVGLWG